MDPDRKKSVITGLKGGGLSTTALVALYFMFAGGGSGDDDPLQQFYNAAQSQKAVHMAIVTPNPQGELCNYTGIMAVTEQMNPTTQKLEWQVFMCVEGRGWLRASHADETPPVAAGPTTPEIEVPTDETEAPTN